MNELNTSDPSVHQEGWKPSGVAIESNPCSPLPCPFCGNPPHVTEWANDDIVTVECAGPCLLKEVTTGRYCTKERAIEAWNTRANAPHQAQAVASRPECGCSSRIESKGE